MIKLKNFSVFFLSYFTSPILLFCLCLSVLGGFFLGLTVIPLDFQQGLYYKIMFIHVPSAWMSLMCYFFMTICAIYYLLYKSLFVYEVMCILCRLGLTFTIITLITGSFWGRPLWGTYWAWDARMSSVAVLFFLYLTIYFIVTEYSKDEKSLKFASIFVIIGFLNLPIIKYSVDWWATLHQSASLSLSSASQLHSSVYISLLLIFSGFLLFSVLYLILELKIKFLTLRFHQIL